MGIGMYSVLVLYLRAYRLQKYINIPRNRSRALELWTTDSSVGGYNKTELSSLSYCNTFLLSMVESKVAVRRSILQ